jgi:hypothetical protein
MKEEGDKKVRKSLGTTAPEDYIDCQQIQSRLSGGINESVSLVTSASLNNSREQKTT